MAARTSRPESALAALTATEKATAPERAADVIDQCRKLGVDLPIAELIDVMPEWSAIVGRSAR